jgi:hypothetical protein
MEEWKFSSTSLISTTGWKQILSFALRPLDPKYPISLVGKRGDLTEV